MTLTTIPNTQNTQSHTERETIDGISEKGGGNQETSECGETER